MNVAEFGGMYPTTTVTCGRHVLAISRLRVATLDAAIAEVQASLGALASTIDRSARTATGYRLEHHNRGGNGTNYWIDQVIVIGGGFYACQASSMAMSRSEHASASEAEVGAAICATLE